MPPKYIKELDGENSWLTITADIFGKWQAGYMNEDGAMNTELFVIADTIDDALKELEQLYSIKSLSK